MIWLTNKHRDEARETRAAMAWPIVFWGRPKASDTYSVEELERMGMVGLYRPDDMARTGTERK